MADRETETRSLATPGHLAASTLGPMRTKPLAAASERLRGVPGFPGRLGRPRKGGSARVPGGSAPRHRGAESGAMASLLDPQSMRLREADVPVTCPPRLLTVKGAAAYLGLSVWQVRGLIHAGTLQPVRILLGHGKARKHLLDRLDLDRLVDTTKA